MTSVFRCCFLMPNNLPATPTFSESRQNSACIRTNNHHDKRSEVIFIKRCPSVWRDDDEASVDDHSTLESSLDIHLSNLSTSSEQSQVTHRKYQDLITAGVLDETNENKSVSWICNAHCQNREYRSSMYTSAKDKKPTNLKISSTSRFLDWLMMCFWNCSPGCQQIATK